MVFDPTKRDNKGRFLKGTVPNPTGRPAVHRDFVARCQQFMEKTGWQNIESIANDPSHQHFMRATELLAAYAYGKPAQRIQHEGGDEGKPIWVNLVPARRTNGDGNG